MDGEAGGYAEEGGHSWRVFGPGLRWIEGVDWVGMGQLLEVYEVRFPIAGNHVRKGSLFPLISNYRSPFYLLLDHQLQEIQYHSFQSL